ncbi:MAG: 2-C-methyl-D-erythritol 4-phosphate cytidylyltransferase [Candidatus Neomarinimicrobiota bacterium]|nr:MAG: 2-C-methyl-D-erythritol 4-phosphate cytidylyltransferase [Candidatus Neomarinimicrobiota bacterium]
MTTAPHPSSLAVVLVAAGAGRRFGEAKQFKLLQGKPLYQYSLEAFLAADLVGEIVLVVPEAVVPSVRKEVIPLATTTPPVTVVAGGERRQDSVLKGVQALTLEADIVAVHDAARPFPSQSYLRAGMDLCRQNAGAVVALPSPDTVKQVDPATGLIETTLPRERIWLAQTPQFCHRHLLLRLLTEAEQSGRTVTDEATLLEQAGESVAVIPGSVENRKITAPEDWTWAQHIVQERNQA